MWEFSWIERRWPGAGYEDWDRALDELAERGYNAVRIDPFPHLLAADPHKTWTLRPEWNTQLWGSPDVNRIVLLPALFEFLGKCRDRGIMVGLSTWYRQDDADTRMTITGPDGMAAQLDQDARPDLAGRPPRFHSLYRSVQRVARRRLGAVREAAFELTATGIIPLRSISCTGRSPWSARIIPGCRCCSPAVPTSPENYLEHDLSDFDLLDPHVWMVQRE